MNPAKLFQVPVIGGAMLGLGCVEEAPPPAGEDAGETTSDASAGTDAATATDAATETDAAMASGEDAGELMECGFCPNDECCETDEMGRSTTRAGMMCCWGTSC